MQIAAVEFTDGKYEQFLPYGMTSDFDDSAKKGQFAMKEIKDELSGIEMLLTNLLFWKSSAKKRKGKLLKTDR